MQKPDLRCADADSNEAEKYPVPAGKTAARGPENKTSCRLFYPYICL
jgi:hypothetical protein